MTTRQLACPPAQPNQRGISLVELLIALIVLSVGILSVAQLMPTGSRHQLQDRMTTRATEYAQEKLEQLMAVDWASADLTVGTHPNAPEAVGPGGRWQRIWLVEQLPGGLSSMKRITITVSWNYQGAKSVRLVSYRGE